jgi:tetratricopeptide (TPR) repeat protein
MDPRCVVAYDGRGDTWCDRNEYAIAIKNYTEAIRLDPKKATLYNDRGDAWLHEKSYDKALADYGQAIRIDPRDPNGYRKRAWIWATCADDQVRDGKKAVASATKACELGQWKDAGAIDTLAAAYAEAGDFDAAVKWETKAVGMVGTGGDKEGFEERLGLYRKGQAYRAPHVNH